MVRAILGSGFIIRAVGATSYPVSLTSEVFLGEGNNPGRLTELGSLQRDGGTVLCRRKIQSRENTADNFPRVCESHRAVAA